MKYQSRFCTGMLSILTLIFIFAGVNQSLGDNELERRFIDLNFNSFKNGTITELSVGDTTITAAQGDAEILAPPNNMSTKMLRITGGKEKSVTIRFHEPVKAGFAWVQMERWTGRSPFACQIEMEIGSQWQEVFTLDESFETGKQPPCTIMLNEDTLISAMRFTVTSAEGGGLLVKNLYLGPLHETRLIGFNARNFQTITTPILIGEAGTPVQQIEFRMFGDTLPTKVEMTLNLENTGFLESAAIMVNDVKHQIALKDGMSKLDIDTTFQIGQQVLSLVLQPKPDAPLGTLVEGGITQLQLGEKNLVFENKSQQWPVARLLVAPGEMEIHTFRIPGLVRTMKGTLLAVYDFRYKHSGDLPADIDVGLSRSVDDGKTWESPRVIMGFDQHDPRKGVGDPAILVDEKTGRIWVAALWAHNGHSIATSKSGLKFGESGQLVLCHSDDDGVTWSEPRNITSEIGRGKDWRIVFNGPGCGITMRNGTLVFAAQYWDASGVPHSTILFSKDRGETWHVGTGARSQTTEAQVVELVDGSLMLNMRDNRGGSRAVAVTKDLGQTWEKHPTSRSMLPEPVCQASLIRVARKDQGATHDTLAFLNPSVRQKRYDMTLQLSEDDGATWSKKLKIYSPECYGYSSMTMMDSQTIGLLYETQGGLIFQKIMTSDVPKE